jgi:hypothetical protein
VTPRLGRLRAVTVTFEQMADEFVRFRDFVLNDLDRIVSQPIGGGGRWNTKHGEEGDRAAALCGNRRRG